MNSERQSPLTCERKPLGVKLAVIRLWSDVEREDYEDAVTFALRDIDRVIGTKFAIGLEEPNFTGAGADYDEEAEDDEETR